MFRSGIIDEPMLEFGAGGRHLDPRVGLMNHGPLQPMVGDCIRVGVIGTGDTVDGFERFLDRARLGIPAKPSPRINLFPHFPGLENQNPFRCKFETDATLQRRIPTADIRRIAGIGKQSEAISAAVDLFIAQASALLEGSSRPDVIVLALPIDLIEKIVNARVSEGSDSFDDDGRGIDFRDMFKARALALRTPSQIVWPSLWDDNAKIPRKIRPTLRQVQDPATRAWNMLNALFYKAGRAPWRLPQKEGALKASFLGIGFYKDLLGQRLLTSTAQMFDERGRGLILRGAKAMTDKGDRHPYLERGDAYDLVKRSLQAFRDEHHQWPARLVVMKTSRFEPGEADGMLQAADELQIAFRDLIWVSEGAHQTFVREGDYPPLRGSYVELGENLLLFSRGSVPYYRTYPGQRIPRPLMLRPYASAKDTPLSELGEEMLGLTKMNWNTTQFDQALPIPIRAARQVGRVLKYVSYAEMERSDYRFYI